MEFSGKECVKHAQVHRLGPHHQKLKNKIDISVRKLKQKDCTLEASLGHIKRYCLKRYQKKKNWQEYGGGAGGVEA